MYELQCHTIFINKCEVMGPIRGSFPLISSSIKFGITITEASDFVVFDLGFFGILGSVVEVIRG